MTPFAFHRPASVASAVQLRSAQPDATYLAGGQSLLPAMKLGLAAHSDLIDLSLLRGAMGVTVDGGSLRIGAMTPHAVVAASADVLKHIPALACLAAGIGDPAVRSRGTLGGSLANNDPAACYPAAVLGLGATVHTDRRQIAADDFFLGLYETALQLGELITAVSFPVPARAAYLKIKQPASRFALVGVFVSEGLQGVRVAVTGAASCVYRANALEAALAKSFSTQALDGLSVPAEDLNSDLHGSAAYRAHLISVLARRAVAQAA
jgi:carbon-monoxide dehydrogenase medium subunit